MKIIKILVGLILIGSIICLPGKLFAQTDTSQVKSGSGLHGGTVSPQSAPGGGGGTTCNMSGSASVQAGNTYSYMLNCSATVPGIIWTVDGGSIILGGNGARTATIQWKSDGTATGHITAGSSTANASLSITINYQPLVAGTASGVQAINYNASATSLFCTAATGGKCSGIYTYQWQKSTDGTHFTGISGASALSYSPGSLTASGYYRVKVTCLPDTVCSNAVLITVYPQLITGSLSPASQSVNYQSGNATPLALSGIAGGNGSYSYQWQSSPNNSFSSPTAISGPTTSYTPGPLTASTYYRVLVTSNGVTLPSAAAFLNVYPQMFSGTVSPASQSINYNTVPGSLSVSGTSGGTGTYTYYWRSCATANGTYTSTGGTGNTYSPAQLTASTYYEVVTSSNGVNITSAPVLVNVYPLLQNPTIGTGAALPILAGSDPGDFTVTPITGGNGIYTYLWQSSPDQSTWTTAGSGGLNFDPGVFYSNTYYRLTITSNGISAASNSFPLTVSPPVNAPGSDVLPGGTASLINIPTYATAPDPNNLNFIRTRTITKPGVLDEPTADALTSAYDAHQVTEYFDGLGRSMQVVDKQANPSQADLVSTMYYDAFGRVAQQYLPYTDNQSTGNFRTDAAIQQPGFYNGYFSNTENYYYGNTIYEASPVNRPLKTTAPGNSWTGNNRGITSQYMVNGVTDSVHLWTITAGETDFPTTASCYPPGTLSVTQTTDENGHSVKEYKDLDGQVVLKKVQVAVSPSTAHDGWLCTYYVYDYLHELRCVVPPKAVSYLNASGWNLMPVTNLCFQYAYDGRKRMILKKAPDAAPVYMIYNLRNLPVLMQDGNQRIQNQWLVTRYDSLNRPVQSGIYAAGTTYSLDAMQGLVNSSQGYPTAFTLNTQTWYDDYSQVTVPGYTGADVAKLASYSNSYPDPVTQSNQTKGFPTTTQVRVLEAPATLWLTTVHYYDEKGRVIQSISDNISGSRDTLTTLYDFMGKALSAYDRHNNVASRLNPRTTILSGTIYDHMGRQTQANKQVNDNGISRIINTDSYDALGQLTQKSLGSNIESLAFEYNIRGWLRGINRSYITNGSSHYFGMELNYDYGYGSSQYNGNIAGMKWKSTGDGIPRAYGYGYDLVNRLVFADFKQDNSQSGNSFADDGKVDFDVPRINYDANGNILTMQQNGLKIGGSSPIDRLSYNYNTVSNQLMAVTDSVPADTSSRLGDFQDRNTVGNDYNYDPNGNLIRDRNKNIDSIRYNYLNLPVYIHINGKGTINYVYDASGDKDQKIVIDSTKGGISDTTTYISGFVYHSDTLQFLSHEEGRLRYVNKINQVSGQPFRGLVYDYFLKDHLGNTRMVLTEEQDTTIYVATEEQKNALTEDQLFNNVNTTQYATPAGFEPSSGADTSNHFVTRLNGSTGGNRIGPSIVLKVMARDTVSANVYGWYQGSTQSPPAGETPLINDLLTSLSNDVVGQSGGHFLGAVSPVSSILSSVLPTFMGVKDASDNTAQPKAFLNWVLFDNQLNYVTGGVTQVPSITGAMSKQVMTGNIPVVSKSGYLYIYVSNESQQDVLFDNLNVQFRRGPLLEENHYYPFGLTMAGISDKALKSNYAENKYRDNGGNELQNKEFSDGSGLEFYDAVNRMYDPQIARFGQIDELGEVATEWSPYTFGTDNPVIFNDPLGLLSDSSHPQVLATAVVTARHSTQNLQNTYLDLTARGISLNRVKDKGLRNWLNNYDEQQKYIQKVHSDIRTQGIIAANIISLAIPVGEIVQLARLGELVQLYRLKRGLAAVETTTALIKSGLNISVHGAERLAERGITEDMIEVGIRKGAKFFDPKNGTINYILRGGFASGKDLLIGANPLTGRITTAIRGSNLINSRFIPL